MTVSYSAKASLAPSRRRCGILSGAVIMSLGLLGLSDLSAQVPDLTAGGVPLDTANINLGPTGMEGWFYNGGSGKLQETAAARQILVTKVDAGSPADGILAMGDVILGADGTGAEPVDFTSDARKALAYAIDDAEGNNPAVLKLLRWRSGVASTVSITLEYLGGSYSPTAPYNCAKSAAILEKGIDYIMSSEPGSGYGGFGTTVLMAVNDPAHPDNAARQARAQAEAHALNLTQGQIDDMTSGDLTRSIGKPWSIGPALIAQAEYYLQTGDSAVLPSIRARAIQIADAQSLFGTMGHHYSLPGPNGEVNSAYGIGYGPVNNAGMPCFIGLILANKCGLADPQIVAGIDRAAKYFQYYADLGTVPYGENKETGSITNNGKSALAAISLGMLEGYESESKYFAKLSVFGADERDSGHTGPFFNQLWTPLASNLGGEDALSRYFDQTSWLYDLARRWNGSFVYQPYYQSGGIKVYGQDHRASWTTLLTYAAPLAKLNITGKDANPALALDAADMADINHAIGYSAATRTTAELLQDLAHPLPQLHWSAGNEIGANRTADHAAILPTLIDMAQNGTTYAEQHGALYALNKIADDSTAPVLSGLLMSTNSKVRYMAANTLKSLSMTAKTAEAANIVNALIAADRPLLPLDPENPMHVDKQAFGQLLFDSGAGIWGGSRVTGADRALLYPAFRIISTAPMGGTRDTAFSVAPYLTRVDVENLAEALVDVATGPPPGEITYANRTGAITAMQANGFAEGVPASILVFNDSTKNKENALYMLEAYAGSSLTVKPDPAVIDFCRRLLSNSDDFDAEAQAVLDAIAADQLPEQLTPFKSIDWIFADKPSLTLPAKSTVLRVHSTDLANGDATYTWRKVHGAGNVSFTPNGTGGAKNTTVVFDGTPGVYTFEVTMSDEKGLTEVTGTVTMSLYDVGGNLPGNTAPTADAQSITAAQGTPTPVVLTASDPQGQGLIYAVTDGPSHGSLSGAAPHLVYTADIAYVGADSFNFEVMDSDGLTSTATVSITVGSVGNVGVAVYEPFDYPIGLFNGASSATEIGLGGSWTANSGMNVVGGSLNYGSLVTTGGSIGNLASASTFGGSRAVNPSALAGNNLLSDGATLWFSAVVGHPGNNYNQNLFLALANSRFNQGGNNYSIDNEGAQLGSGVGVSVLGGQALATQFRDASQGTIGTSGHVQGTWSSFHGSVGTYGQRVVVGRITWGPGADTIEIYLPDDDLVLPSSPSSVLTVDVNQSTYDTLTFSRSGVPVLDEIRFGATYQSVLQGTTPMSADTIAPTPDPMTFAVAPVPNSPSSITMTATPAHDALEVEYYFTCTSGGGHDSGWQASRVYTDTGLTPGVAYGYTVKARDKFPGHNETLASASATATIPSAATVPDVVGILQTSAESVIASSDLTVGTVTTATAYSLTVPAGHVLSQLPAGDTSTAYGSPVDLVISIGQDPALPTLAAFDIVDDQNGGPVVVNTLMTYTLTFSEDMNAATVDAADFTNLGTAAISIGTIAETSPGVFTVQVTPTGTGTLRFAIAEGAALQDAQGGAFNTAVALIDDTVITINFPDEEVPNVVGMTQSAAESAITAANLVVGSVNSIYDASVPAGNVISQNPAFGSSIPGQSAVNLVVSLGSPPDTTGPVVASLSPADGTYNVEVDAELRITFDENVFANSGNIIIRNLNDGTDVIVPVGDPSQVLAYANILTISPTVDLEPGQSYAVRIPAGAVVDASGNEFLGISDNRTWNLSTALSPLASVLFTENFESPDVAAYTQGSTPANWVKANQGFNSSLHGLTDKAGGNFSAPDPNHQGYAFRYGNTGITTAEGAVGTITADTTYEVSFDVIQDLGTNGTAYSVRMLAFPAGALRNDCRSNGTATQLATTTGSATTNGFFTTVTFQATVAAGSSAVGQDFAVRILGSGSSAVVDNVVVRTVTPSAGDEVPPAIAALTPVDDSVQVSLTNNLRIVFDENIDIGAGFITLRNLTTTSQTVINVIDGNQVLINGDTLEINPAEDLDTNTFYAVRIDPGAITDLAGNGFPGIGDDTSWSFNTGEVSDDVAPTVLAYTPADGATGVSYSASLGLTFDENVVVGAGNITLKNLTDATELVMDAADAGQVSASGQNVTFNPAVYLGEGKQYAVRIDAGVFLDLAGNAYAGIADDVAWSFTTAANNPPAIVSFDPSDEAVNVDIASSLGVTFDETITAGTGNITIRDITNATDLVIDINDTSQVSISGASLTINPAGDFAEAANYAVLIDNGAIEDLAGNPFGGIASDATWNFVTGVSTVGLVFSDDFEVSSGSPDVDAIGSAGSTSKKTGPNWVRSTVAFNSSHHGIVDESSGQFTDLSGEQAYAFRYTNSGLTTKEAVIGALQAGATYRVSLNVVKDGSNNGSAYSVGLVTFAPGATRTSVVGMGDNTSKVLATRSGTYNGTAYKLISFEFTASEVADAAVLGHDVAIRLDGSGGAAIIDNVQITVNGGTGGGDTTPPTLASADIVDNQDGGPIDINTPVTYTVTFSEDMNEATVSAADFGNAGSAAIAIGSVAETDPGVFTVQVTPTSGGTLQLQVNAGAVLEDPAGNALDTTAAIADDTTIGVTANSAPVWSDDPVLAADASEDAAYNATLASNASDADEDPLAFAKVDGSAWLNIAANGALSGTPSQADVGPNVITVSVSDGIAAPVEVALNITVINTNDAPVFAANPIIGADATKDQVYNGSIGASATDADGDNLTYAKVSGPAWLAVAANGALSGTPGSGDVGTNVFTVSASDGIAAPVQATLEITVLDTNAAPVWASNPINAADATVDAAYSETLAGAATDADEDALTFAKVSGPAWLGVAPDGSLSGTPGIGDVGANGFTVSVSDGTASAVEAALNIIVQESGSVIVFADDFEPGANAFGGTTPDVTTYTLANTSGQANTNLWVRATSGFGATRNGLLDESENGGANFTDPAGTQAYGFRYTNSGVTTAEGKIGALTAGDTIHVSFDVVADGYNAGTAYNALLVLFDSGVARNAVEQDIKNTAAVLAKSSGTVANNGAYHTITFSYTVGDDVVDNNGAASGVSTGFLSQMLGKDVALRFAGAVSAANIDNVQISKGSDNTAPQWTANPVNEADASEDAAYSATLADNATDDDGNPLAFAKLSGPAWLSVSTDGTLSGMPGNGDVGANVFTVSVSDAVAAPVEATLNITVTNTNDSPVFASNPIIGDAATEDSAYAGSLAGSASDVDAGATLSYAKVSGPAWLVVAANGDLSGTPVNGDVGTNSFTLSVSDGIAAPVEATLEITVINTNDAPVFAANPIPGADATEDAAYTASLAGSAADDDGDEMTYTKVSGPAWLNVSSDGTLSGTPTNDDVGANSFTVAVSDGIAPAVEAVLEIEVINTNDAPVFAVNPIAGADATEDSAYAGTLAGAAADPDAGATLAYAKVSGPAWLVVAANGDLSGTPENSDVGVNGFTVSVSDGIAPAAEAILEITVINTNDAPVFAANPIPGTDATEDSAYSGTLAGSATDDDSDALTYAKVSGPAWLNVSADGTLSGTPENSDVGANGFTVSVSDGISLAVEAILEITVINTEDAPAWAANPVIGTGATEDALYSGTLAGSASDVDAGATLAYAKVSGPAWLNVSADGTLSGTPANGDVGANAFVVSVTDGNSDPVEAGLEIAVTNTNDAPVFTTNPITAPGAAGNEPYSGTLDGSATDDDGDPLTYAKVSGPAWLNVSTEGTLSGTPAASDVGATRFIVSVSDGIAAPQQAALEILVSETPPVLVLADDFEPGSNSFGGTTADVTNYNLTNTSKSANTTLWVRSKSGFGADRNGILDETESAGANFADPAGTQAYGFRYTNSGVTTAEGLIGALEAGTTIHVSFDAVRDGWNGGRAYDATLVVFDSGAARNAVEFGAKGTAAVLARAADSVPADADYHRITLSYTVGDDVVDNNGATSGTDTGFLTSLLGKDIALRFDGATDSANIDNVEITIDSGTATPPLSVPAVTGLAQADATAAILSAGLVQGILSEQQNASVPAGDVISQTPAAGTPLAGGSAVDLVVSIGQPMVTVPDVVGFTQPAAETTITGASLTVGNVTEEYSDTVPEGEIISQGLAPGSSVQEGSQVGLVVSLGLDFTPKLMRTTVSAVSNTAWTTVDLGRAYHSPVIIATPIYPNATLPPVVTRIRNVTATGFEVKIDRADGLTDPVSIDVSVIAVDEGVYTLAEHGVNMEAVKFTSTVTARKGSWVAEARVFQNPYASPVVVGQVMSANDTRWSAFWSMGASVTDPVDAANLNVGKHVGEDTVTTRADETIGYIVIESGTGSIGGVGFEAGLGLDTVQGFGDSATPYTYMLSGNLASAGAAAASISGMNGNDGAWAVLSGSPAITPNSLGLHACEDRMADAEQSHITEQVGYIVFE